jgi:hypothetical protein
MSISAKSRSHPSCSNTAAGSSRQEDSNTATGSSRREDINTATGSNCHEDIDTAVGSSCRKINSRRRSYDVSVDGKRRRTTAEGEKQISCYLEGGQ